MKLHMKSPVFHTYFMWQPIEHTGMSKVKVKVIKDIKTTVWAITFEPGWLQNIPAENTYQNHPSRHDVRRTVFASRTTYDFCMFSKFVKFVPIDLKIGTHIGRT